MKLDKIDPRSRITTTSNDRAVSPVIGVILMVAITVVLAAVIGVFVIGLGDEVSSSAPAVTLDIADVDSATAGEIEISNDGGDTLQLNEDVTLLVEGTAEVEPGGWSSDTLAPGESVVEVSSQTGSDLEVQIRHDPSGSIIATAEIDIS